MGKKSRDKGARGMCEARRVLCEIMDVPCVPALLPTGKQAIGTKAAPDLVGFPFSLEVKWYKKMRPAVEKQARAQALESASQYDGIPLVMLREDGNTRWRIQLYASLVSGKYAWLELANNEDLWKTRNFGPWREEYIKKVWRYDEEQREKHGDKYKPYYEAWIQSKGQ